MSAAERSGPHFPTIGDRDMITIDNVRMAAARIAPHVRRTPLVSARALTDAISAKEEIGRYIEHYHHRRPHQALMNFTPAHVHEQNNKSRLLAELKEMKRKTREKRKEFWSRRSETTVEFDSGGSLGMGRPRSVYPGANTQAVFQEQLSDSRIESSITGNDSLGEPVLSH